MEQFLQQSYINDIVMNSFYETSKYPEEFKELEETSKYKEGETFTVPESVYVIYKGNLYEVRILLVSINPLEVANYIIDIRSFDDEKLFSYMSVTAGRYYYSYPDSDPPNLIIAADKIMEINSDVTDLYK